MCQCRCTREKEGRTLMSEVCRNTSISRKSSATGVLGDEGRRGVDSEVRMIASDFAGATEYCTRIE